MFFVFLFDDVIFWMYFLFCNDIVCFFFICVWNILFYCIGVFLDNLCILINDVVKVIFMILIWKEKLKNEENNM